MEFVEKYRQHWLQHNIQDEQLKRHVEQTITKLIKNKQIGSLVGSDLRYLNLSELDLSGINLERSNLSFTDLSNCNLTNANLSRSVARGAKIINSKLDNAHIIGVCLSEANLSGSSFTSAVITQTSLDHSIIENANFEKADLKQTDFTNARIHNTNFLNSNLTSTIGLTSNTFNNSYDLTNTKSTNINRSSTIYSSLLSLRPVINCIGTMTSLGGSRMDNTVMDAMKRATETFVDLNALNKAAGNYIANVIGVAPNLGVAILTGAATGLALSVAGCITGPNRKKVADLPKLAYKYPNVIIMDAQSDRRWNASISLSGAEILFIEFTPLNLEYALVQNANRVAAVLVFAGGRPEGEGIPIDEIVKISHRFNVSVVCDAAAQLPPKSNLTKFTSMGVDLVIFSGGKAIGGPQTSGFVIGKHELIEAILMNSSPNESSIGRPMKCAKEDIIGLVVALERFMKTDESIQMAYWESVVKKIENELCSVKGIKKAYRVCPGPPDIQPNFIPRAYIDLDEGVLEDIVEKKLEPTKHGDSASEFYGESVDHSNPLNVHVTSHATLLAKLLTTSFPEIVAVNTSKNGIVINPQTLREDEVIKVVEYIKQCLLAMMQKKNKL